jgi:ABC-type amino acid transport substrate-binding protein
MVIYIEDNILSAEDDASLSVSIGIKKGNDEFGSQLNTALDSITTETRESIMEQMVNFNLTNDEANDNIRTKLTGSKGKIVVGLECNYPSFNWTETEQNNFTYPIAGKSREFAEGYDVEIAYLLASALDMTLEIQKMGWDALLIWANK